MPHSSSLASIGPNGSQGSLTIPPSPKILAPAPHRAANKTSSSSTSRPASPGSADSSAPSQSPAATTPSANPSSSPPKKAQTHLSAVVSSDPSSSSFALPSPIARPAGPAPKLSTQASPPPLSPNTITARFNMITGSGTAALPGPKVFARDDLETVSGSGLPKNSNLVRNLSVLLVPVPDDDGITDEAEKLDAAAPGDDLEMKEVKPTIAPRAFLEPEEDDDANAMKDSPLMTAQQPARPTTSEVSDSAALASAAAVLATTTTESPAPPKLTHRMTWSVATEKGYRRLPSNMIPPPSGESSPTTASGYPRHPIHPDLEDVHWPPAIAHATGLLAPWAADGGVALAGSGSENADDELHAGGGVRGLAMSATTAGTPSTPGSNDGDEGTRRVRSKSEVGLDKKKRGLSPWKWSTTKSASTSDLTQQQPAAARGSPSPTPSLGLPEGTAVVEEGKGGVVRAMVESLSGTTRIFVLADGHGGVQAARFFVPRLRDSLMELMTSRSWDFAHDEDRESFTQETATLFKFLDTEYCAIQVAAYRRWVDAGSVHGARPADDGCTMVVVVVHGDHVVSLNVGDSRAVVVSREPVVAEPRSEDAMDEDLVMRIIRGEDRSSSSLLRQSRWTPVFSTDDHNMAHPGKVWDIHRAGGHFINPNGTLKHVVVSPPEQRRHRAYDELNGARIYRHPTDAVRAVGVSHKRTLNLTATMGDLLFKIEPAILSPVPDVKFVRLAKDREYVILLATDGVWDHLRNQSSHVDQNLLALGVVASAVESIPAQAETFLPNEVLTERLGLAARALVLRETDVERTHPWFLRDAVRDLFLRGQIRYDDATALVVYLEPVEGKTEVPAAAPAPAEADREVGIDEEEGSGADGSDRPASRNEGVADAAAKVA
ncbi:Protein phosphatase 1D [Phlyctochytrium bullatum]|nr:Protein phosphatase 1D [Phlyctochytrium bullatum]